MIDLAEYGHPYCCDSCIDANPGMHYAATSCPHYVLWEHEMMKPLEVSAWKQRGIFFLAGAAFTVICGVIQFKWMDIVPYYAFDQQPDWLKGLARVVGWLPWIAAGLVLVLRFVKGRHVRVVFFLLGTAAPLMILLGMLFFGDTVADLMHRQQFDAGSWCNQEQIEHDPMWPPRLCMVDDLMSSGRLDGLTRSQVVDLLGPPADQSCLGGAQACDIHYYVGPERGFIRIDSEWLVIAFGDDGKVNRYWLCRD